MPLFFSAYIDVVRFFFFVFVFSRNGVQLQNEIVKTLLWLRHVAQHVATRGYVLKMCVIDVCL